MKKMNNYCTNCGEKLQKDAKECPKCEVEQKRLKLPNLRKKNESILLS